VSDYGAPDVTSTAGRRASPVRQFKGPKFMSRPAVTSWAKQVFGPATIAAWALLTYHFWQTEGSFWNVVFTLGVTVAIAAVITLLTRRPLFASWVTFTLVAIVSWTASIKRATMSMVVHAYDLVFYLSSWSTITYLWSDHRGLFVAFLAALLLGTFVSRWAYRLDGLRVARLPTLVIAIMTAAVGALGAELKGERRHMQFNFEGLYVSSFYASWAETLIALRRGALIEAAEASPSGPPRVPFQIPTSCTLPRKPPHIILIHQESIVPPSLFKGLAYDKAVDQMFKSDDGKIHKLRVETYGGASWLTEFSLLAGVSTQSFGGMRQFVQTFMQNRLEDTLSQTTARCGYRNVIFYPMLKNFVSNDKFYRSIALNEIYDLKDQKAPTSQERDRFYFANALADIETHVKASAAPLFTYIQTMSAHWPYDIKMYPGEDVPGGGAGTDPEMHEYLRRVSLAHRDYTWLLAELKKRFPQERFVVVSYGDHHPTATRTLLGFKAETEAEDVALDRNSLGYITYYAVRGINYTPPPLPLENTIDVPYLGAVVLNVAGLPLSDANRERKRLLSLCGGRYNECPRREEILTFHRRLIDSGILKAR
jgi:phosphoglycerol transferase MdoB-like AlkP superfamily enzyme